MSEYDKRNKGVLFANDKRESDRHPNAKGNLTTFHRCPRCNEAIAVDHWLSAWTKQSDKGTRYQRIATQPKNKALVVEEGSVKPDRAIATEPPVFNDDIPF